MAGRRRDPFGVKLPLTICGARRPSRCGCRAGDPRPPSSAMTILVFSTDAPTGRFDLLRHGGPNAPRLEDFLVLAPRQENPRADVIESRSLELAERLELVNDHNRARFDAFNTLGRHVYPTASIE